MGPCRGRPLLTGANTGVARRVDALDFHKLTIT